jgi:glyoxylase-like metal-dependent hydrolase (beta-lactamase superfamily II)
MMKKSVQVILIVLLAALNASSQTVNYEVYALKFATVEHALPISAVALRGPDNDSVNLFFLVWLVKGDNGKNVLVDAGFINDIAEAKDFSVKNYIRPDSLLFKVNLKREDITDIILTHPHWDHIDGIDLFPNAHTWIQKEDYNYFTGQAWQTGGNNWGFNKRDVRKLIELNLAGKLTLVDGDDKEIFPGIKVYPGSRHTFNSQFVLVKTGVDKILLASDNIWSYYNLDHLVSVPTYGTFDTTAYVTSMKRMKTLASDVKYIIPGHDPKMFSIFPVIDKDIIKIR